MPNHLDTLRAVHARANNCHWRVDDDLDAEAGMDGNYGRLLQAARNLDTQSPNPDALTYIARSILVAYLVAEQTGESIDEVTRLDVLVELARTALPADVVVECEHDAASTVAYLANLSA